MTEGLEVELYACVECGIPQPAAGFAHYWASRVGHIVREGRCKACRKRWARSRTAESRREARAREAARKGKEYRTAEQRSADRELALRGRAEAHALICARKELTDLLTALMRQRAEEQGIRPVSMAYRLRYWHDDVFRQREVARTQIRKRRHRRLEKQGTLTAREVNEILRDASSCVYCTTRLSPANRTIDHVIPLIRGGQHTRENVVVSCRSCNSRKSARTPMEWVFGVPIATRRFFDGVTPAGDGDRDSSPVAGAGTLISFPRRFPASRG